MPDRRPIHRKSPAGPVLATTAGIAAAAALLLAPPGAHGSLVDESTVFANRTRAARDAAVVDGRPVRLWLTGAGYGFDERSGNRWTPMTEEGLRPRRWRPGMAVTFPAAPGRGTVVFGATGSADRDMTVSFARRPDVLRVTIDRAGKVATFG